MESSFLHAPAWQAFLEAYGFPTLRLNDQLYSQRHLPGGKYWLGSRVQLTLPTLQGFPAAFGGNSWFVRVEPLDPPSYEALQQYAEQQKLPLYSRPAVQPRQSLCLDCSQTDEALLKGMKPKHRYNIRLASRHALQFEAYAQDLDEPFERFWQLLARTSERQQFRTHPKSYYQQMLSHLAQADMAHLLLVSQEGKDLAGMILVHYQGVATYLHGGSDETYKACMAPYLLHWEALRLARSLGCTTYDFWGTDAVFSPQSQQWLPQEGKGSYGTTRFKLGFGGQIREYPGSFDLVFKQFCYTGYRVYQKVRRSQRAFS